MIMQCLECKKKYPVNIIDKEKKCPSCGYEDPEVKAWDGVSAR